MRWRSFGWRARWVLRDGAELPDTSVWANDEGKRERVPVFVCVGRVVAGGCEGTPVFAVVGGDVGAVGAYGDPEFLVAS